MHEDLDTQIKHHYRNAALSAEQLERIQEATGREKNRARLSTIPWVIAAMVAAVMLFPAIAVISPGNQVPPIASLSADISRNHLASNQADFYASDLDALAHLFESSGLNVRLPDLLNVHGQIKGARLCSLAGQPAIHVYFSDTEDERKSLFIAKAEGALESASKVAVESDSIAILTWAEDGHFYALAKDFK